MVGGEWKRLGKLDWEEEVRRRGNHTSVRDSPLGCSQGMAKPPQSRAGDLKKIECPGGYQMPQGILNEMPSEELYFAPVCPFHFPTSGAVTAGFCAKVVAPPGFCLATLGGGGG